jgi:hypothetical protein
LSAQSTIAKYKKAVEEMRAKGASDERIIKALASVLIQRYGRDGLEDIAKAIGASKPRGEVLVNATDAEKEANAFFANLIDNAPDAAKKARGNALAGVMSDPAALADQAVQKNSRIKIDQAEDAAVAKDRAAKRRKVRADIQHPEPRGF